MASGSLWRIANNRRCCRCTPTDGALVFPPARQNDVIASSDVTSGGSDAILVRIVLLVHGVEQGFRSAAILPAILVTLGRRTLDDDRKYCVGHVTHQAAMFVFAVVGGGRSTT